MFTTSVFPSAWKMARVIPIPKVRGSRIVEYIRPIIILPALSKIGEHLMKQHLHDFLDDQYGFRRGLSTTTHLLLLTDSIRQIVDSGDSGVLVALDIFKAFDRIDYGMLINKLKMLFKFSSSACKLIYSYISEVRKIYSGVPRDRFWTHFLW